jgi:hypothetical protein
MVIALDRAMTVLHTSPWVFFCSFFFIRRIWFLVIFVAAMMNRVWQTKLPARGIEV